MRFSKGTLRHVFGDENVAYHKSTMKLGALFIFGHCTGDLIEMEAYLEELHSQNQGYIPGEPEKSSDF